MALLFKDPFVAGFHGFSQVGGRNEQRFHFPGMVSFDGRNGFRINASSEFNLRGSSDHLDRFQKAHAVAPYPEILRDSKGGVGEAKKGNRINGHGAVEHGNPLGFPGHPMPEKLVVAVDVDEVLGTFVSALNKFIADRYSLNHTVSEYHVYEFFKIWKCSRDEADIRVHEFFKTPYFKKGIQPIPGALSALHKLSKFCDLSVVTSRQNVIKDHTVEWIEKHFPGLFQEIHFGNHFALDGNSRPKSDICRSLGAHVLIDDNPRYAIECADAGMRVLLFDYENSYPWSKTDSATQHPSVTKVHNWEEVEKQLLSWVMS
ncbi:Haloacid dehalogenase-like hydrolase (HAD) superfamily protein [Thalictrum thalictroides]|uniref:Haloacid dehalogenase-like hydrolase (HAD) superfamily protein n=1 Tax=Thalictrum thalictroides TaxID=46969 RepID=A0A7J6WP29_THATH|nr:Haloacid dehalogenase-like hydrolase (HAD) superfamily protein [Thalictrum thalictroides]